MKKNSVTIFHKHKQNVKAKDQFYWVQTHDIVHTFI